MEIDLEQQVQELAAACAQGKERLAKLQQEEKCLQASVHQRLFFWFSFWMHMKKKARKMKKPPKKNSTEELALLEQHREEQGARERLSAIRKRILVLERRRLCAKESSQSESLLFFFFFFCNSNPADEPARVCARARAHSSASRRESGIGYPPRALGVLGFLKLFIFLFP